MTKPHKIESNWEAEFYDSDEAVIDQSRKCEGKHDQQVSYSTYHRAFTQTCFDCKKVRTSK